MIWVWQVAKMPRSSSVHLWPSLQGTQGFCQRRTTQLMDSNCGGMNESRKPSERVVATRWEMLCGWKERFDSASILRKNGAIETLQGRKNDRDRGQIIPSARIAAPALGQRWLRATTVSMREAQVYNSKRMSNVSMMWVLLD